jgi:hypothetical protein
MYGYNVFEDFEELDISPNTAKCMLFMYGIMGLSGLYILYNL